MPTDDPQVSPQTRRNNPNGNGVGNSPCDVCFVSVGDVAVSDIFTQKHARDRQQADKAAREVAEKELVAASKQRIADAKKPKFNDLPVFKPKFFI